MEDILTEILSWENILKNEKKIRYKLNKISNCFRSIKKYKNSFEALFFEELKSQFDRILEKNLSKEKTLFARVISTGIKNKKFILNGIVTKGHIHDLDKRKLALIIKKEIKNNKPKIEKCFGIVDKKITRSGNLFLEMNFINWKNFKKKQFINIIIFKQTSGLMGMIGEFDVLNSIKNINPVIKNLILTSKDNYSKREEKLINFVDRIHLLKHFNRSQVEAIISFLKTNITLIQGPPGTGKTRTILGVISILNLIQENLNMNLLFKSGPEKILVCAPSNAAIDENVMRACQSFILLSKLFKKWPIKIIRLGPNFHPALDHVSLENYAIILSSDIDQKMRLGAFNKIFRKMRIKILKWTPIIFTTLACTGYSVMKISKKTETVIVDEAGQAIELSTLIPIKRSCKKIILIGDVQQLPATVFSKFSADFGYNRSLFKRFQIHGFKIKFLENQHRMHPQISSFPARKFYRNCLKDSVLVNEIKKFQILRCFGPLIFFNVCEGQEQPHLANLSSWCNLDELRVLSFILRALICLNPGFNTGSIGVIGGYNGQIDEIKGYKILKNKDDGFQVNTIDGFQGREKDLIVFTCVRAKVEKGIGFLGDCRRVNVGFTRAKNGFWLIGNSHLLSGDINWLEAIKDTKKRTKLIAIRKPFERSARKLIYWSSYDNVDYSDDGETRSNLYQNLTEYLKYLYI